jgi:hypothetical protein
MAKTYSEKLKDPKWQRKRLEILNRDNFTCQECFDKENMLVIHHKIYEGSDPWDTCNEGLVTLCQDCHDSEHQRKKEDERLFLDSFYKAGYLSHDLLDLGCGFSSHWGNNEEEAKPVLSIVYRVLKSNEFREKVYALLKNKGN